MTSAPGNMQKGQLWARRPGVLYRAGRAGWCSVKAVCFQKLPGKWGSRSQSTLGRPLSAPSWPSSGWGKGLSGKSGRDPGRPRRRAPPLARRAPPLARRALRSLPPSRSTLLHLPHLRTPWGQEPTCRVHCPNFTRGKSGRTDHDRKKEKPSTNHKTSFLPQHSALSLGVLFQTFLG